MRFLTVSTILLLGCTACTGRFPHVEGVYDMVGYRGKPLPFDGVRSGKLVLTVDGEFSVWTQRAVVMGKPESVVDTVFGRFALRGWSGECTSIVLRAADTTVEPEVWADVCGEELEMDGGRGLFRKRK
jgi:hypothetical protein